MILSGTLAIAPQPAAPATVPIPILFNLFSAVSVPPLIISAASRSVASPHPITAPPAAHASTLLPTFVNTAFHAAPPRA